MSSGILFVATEPKFIREAKLSAKSIKDIMDIPIAVVSQGSVESELFDHVIIDENPALSWEDKVRNLSKTPFDKTLYLDTDVFVVDDITGLFDLLDYADIVTTVDPNEYELKQMGQNPFDIPEEFPIYQTGVILYKKTDSIIQLLDGWIDLHNSTEIERDQTTFRKLMYDQHGDVTFRTISNNYNFFVNSPMRAIDEVKIVHDTKNDITNLSELKKYNSILNNSKNKRLFYTYNDEIYMPISGIGNVLFRLITVVAKLGSQPYTVSKSIREDGISSTIQKIQNKIN